jgi:hypothetical protein
MSGDCSAEIWSPKRSFHSTAHFDGNRICKWRKHIQIGIAAKLSSFYDLFSVENGKIDWDRIETIHDRIEWKSNNGRF